MLTIIHSATRRVPIWSVYLLLTVPSVYYFYLAATGMLSVEPIKALEHKLGEFGLQLIVFGLAITPLRRHLGLNLMRFRRAIGVMTYFYISVHLLVWLVLDVQVLETLAVSTATSHAELPPPITKTRLSIKGLADLKS